MLFPVLIIMLRKFEILLPFPANFPLQTCSLQNAGTMICLVPGTEVTYSAAASLLFRFDGIFRVGTSGQTDSKKTFRFFKIPRFEEDALISFKAAQAPSWIEIKV